jgi:hypothetical protein
MLKLFLLLFALVAVVEAKPYDIPEAKLAIALPEKGWRVTRENQPSGPIVLRAVFIADGGAAVTVASVKGGPVNDESLTEFAEGMRMFFGDAGGRDIAEEKIRFSGVPAIRMKGSATVMGTTREQEVTAYLIGEVGWVVVLSTPEGDLKGLAAVRKLVVEIK